MVISLVNKQKKMPDSRLIKMWRLSEAIDSVVHSSLKEGVAPDEIAAIIANRLGMCLAAQGAPEPLVQYCCQVVQREAAPRDPKGANAV